MRVRLLAVVAVFFSVLAFSGPSRLTGEARAQTLDIPFGVASESYYQLDTATGVISARVHAEYINLQSAELVALPVWVMPGATDVVVKSGDQVLEHQLTPGSEAGQAAGSALATLPKPLKKNLRITLETTYQITQNDGTLIRIEPGAIETPLIGQGHGSFVFIDVPTSGDNVLDPGCLLAADQPGSVKEAGLERWVCGDMLSIALAIDDPDVLARCAQLDDKCRQRVDAAVFSAYVLSVSDETKRGVLESPVTMPDGREVTLTLRYFKRDSDWATRQFDVAKQAFPLLEQSFGFPYPFDDVTMRESHHLDAMGAAGVAFSRVGEVFLATGTGVDDYLTVHELATSGPVTAISDSPSLRRALRSGAPRWWPLRLASPRCSGIGSRTTLTCLSPCGAPCPAALPTTGMDALRPFWFAYEQGIGRSREHDDGPLPHRR